MKVFGFILLLVIACSSLSTAERYIGLLINPGYVGEISFAYRIQAACNNIGWKADVLNMNTLEELEKKNYDFVISLVPGIYKHPKCKNYLAIFHPLHHFFNKNGSLFKHYRLFDGYLLTYSPCTIGNEKMGFANDRKFPSMQWYPTVQKLKFQTTDPVSLFHICCPWGDRFIGKKFIQCLSLLDKESSTRFYGSPIFRKHYPHSYQGEIPYNDNSLYELSSQAGITLVLHSAAHNAYE